MKLKELSVFFEVEEEKLGFDKLAADCIQAIYERLYSKAMEKIGLVINELDRVKICCHDQTSSGFWFEISASLRLLPQHFEYKDYQITYNIPRLYVCLSADMKSLKKAKFYQIARILDLKKHIKRRNQEISEADIIAFLAHQYIYVLKLGSLDSFKDKFMKIAEEKWQEIEKEIKTSKK